MYLPAFYTHLRLAYGDIHRSDTFLGSHIHTGTHKPKDRAKDIYLVFELFGLHCWERKPLSKVGQGYKQIHHIQSSLAQQYNI